MASPLDTALTRFAATDLEFSDGGFDGLSNHGPMAAEALDAMGFADAVPRFVEAYAPRLRPFVSATRDGDDGEVQRGHPQHGARWVAHYEQELARKPWAEVVRAEVPALLDGVAAAAFHGLLRTTHAVRALQRAETDARRRELAFGLGYWASRHQTLPGLPARRPLLGIGKTLATLRLIPRHERNDAGLILERFGVLDGRLDFVEAIEQLDVGDDPDAALTELCGIAARLVLVAPPRAQFVYLHGFTGSAALRVLLPYVVPKLAHTAVAYQVQAVAAVHVTHADHETLSRASDFSVRDTQDPSDLTQQASQSLDDHTIKFVEAAVREYAVAPDPVYLAAAARRLATAP